MPEPKEEEESTVETGSSKGNDEEELVTPPLDKRHKMDTRLIGKKKPGLEFKTPVAPARPTKTPGKGGSSHKKPRGK